MNRLKRYSLILFLIICLDILTTIIALALGHQELNPLGRGGMFYLYLVNILFVSIVLLLFFNLRDLPYIRIKVISNYKMIKYAFILVLAVRALYVLNNLFVLVRYSG